MSSSGDSSDCQVVHVLQRSVSSSASCVTPNMGPLEGGVVCSQAGSSHLIGRPSQPSHSQMDSSQEPADSASSSQQYTVEEQVTTVHLPMRRANLDFLEILHEVGARGDTFTMSEIIHHVKNYIIKYQLFDKSDPRVVHCGNNKLGTVLKVDKFTITEAVSLFMKSTYPSPDSCIRFRRQLVKKTVDTLGAASTSQDSQEGGCAASTVTSTTDSEDSTAKESPAESAMRAESGSASSSFYTFSQGSKGKDEPDSSENRQSTSVNIEYGDEVDGSAPVIQVNMELNVQHSPHTLSQAPEEDSVSLQYDSDQFAVEYELEASDQLTESEHSSSGAKKDLVFVQKESDVEFWADYSDTETNSDTELGDADHWRCETCNMLNVPFYRNCSKCWALRPHWLPDSSQPSSSNPLPAEPCGSQHGYYAQSSNDEQLDNSQASSTRLRVGDKSRRRRVRVVSASSSDPSSESLVSLSEDETPKSTTTKEEKDNSGVSSTAHVSSQEVASSQGTETGDNLSQSQTTVSSQDSQRGAGGKWRGRSRNSDRLAASADVCMVCVNRPKTGCIIHGRTGHQVCCYTCAKRLWKKGLPCPVCRRTIQKVIRNFVS